MTRRGIPILSVLFLKDALTAVLFFSATTGEVRQKGWGLGCGGVGAGVGAGVGRRIIRGTIGMRNG